MNVLIGTWNENITQRADNSAKTYKIVCNPLCFETTASTVAILQASVGYGKTPLWSETSADDLEANNTQYRRFTNVACWHSHLVQFAKSSGPFSICLCPVKLASFMTLKWTTILKTNRKPKRTLELNNQQYRGIFFLSISIKASHKHSCRDLN